jgi:hypothetical protein
MNNIEGVKEVIALYLVTPHPGLPPQGGKEINESKDEHKDSRGNTV